MVVTGAALADWGGAAAAAGAGSLADWGSGEEEADPPTRFVARAGAVPGTVPVTVVS